MIQKNKKVLYRHVRLDKNEVFYVGIGNPKRPYDRYFRNNWWKNIVAKTDYRIDILFDDLTWEEACEKEKEFISLYGRRDLGKGPLVNLTDGGDSIKGYVMTQEHKNKISKANKGNTYRLSEETKRRKGLPSKRKGIKLPKQHAAKIKKSRSGSGAGKKQRPVLQLDGNGKVLCRYNSISHAAKMVSGFQSAISACCKGRVKTHKGFKWECE